MLASFSLIWPFEVANFGPSELVSWQVRDGGIFKARPGENAISSAARSHEGDAEKGAERGGLGRKTVLFLYFNASAYLSTPTSYNQQPTTNNSNISLQLRAPRVNIAAAGWTGRAG